jgi:hypothetical protein
MTPENVPDPFEPPPRNATEGVPYSAAASPL